MPFIPQIAEECPRSVLSLTIGRRGWTVAGALLGIVGQFGDAGAVHASPQPALDESVDEEGAVGVFSR